MGGDPEAIRNQLDAAVATDEENLHLALGGKGLAEAWRQGKVAVVPWLALPESAHTPEGLKPWVDAGFRWLSPFGGRQAFGRSGPGIDLEKVERALRAISAVGARADLTGVPPLLLAEAAKLTGGKATRLEPAPAAVPAIEGLLRIQPGAFAILGDQIRKELAGPGGMLLLPDAQSTAAAIAPLLADGTVDPRAGSEGRKALRRILGGVLMEYLPPGD